ncbi:Rieske (2Fe-2S) protein [Marinoscillum luteum]|jgi:nitrite reductase/ring-hydroxylating ferredoxin subunit|uniref:Rieske (2Fe-2S) protein n=1 Tax=Marinoscillum luteum TaxID=861051 RepID=A0ABW7N8F8_9BACT
MKEEVILFQSISALDSVLKDRKIIQISYNEQKYALTRFGTRIFVFEPKCPHFDYPLVEASVNGACRVVCPWHGYQFDLSTGQELIDRCRPLSVQEATWNADGQLVTQL